MNSLGEWMNGLLVGWGVEQHVADAFDEVVIALLMVGMAVGLDYLCQALFVGGMKHYAGKRPRLWSTLLLKHRVAHHFIHVLPGVLMFYALPLAFVSDAVLLAVVRKATLVYIVTEVLLAVNGVLQLLLDVYNNKGRQKGRSLRGLVQVFQVVLVFVGLILAGAILLDKSPASLLTGLGASAAVLMLVFKDTLLGLVAGVQLSANDMLRIGDWVQLPGGTANGIVEEVTLNTVKIRNWDKTVSTIPPYTLVNNPFVNWRGMKESGGRRVNKLIYIDMTTLCFCSPELLERVRATLPLLADYRPGEGERPTNGQLFRVYVERYLASLPVVNSNMDMIIAQKEPTTYGVPIQVYFFLYEKSWREYERIQSDIFDHLLVMVQAFDLKLYQYTN